MSRTKTVAAQQVLQVRIELMDFSPPIWRRIQVSANATFWDLHVAIQSAMGWNDSHLHEFEVVPPAGVVVPYHRSCSVLRFGIPLEDEAQRPAEERPLPGWDFEVAAFAIPGAPAMAYCYDFGDNWRHSVELESITDAQPGKSYPRCIAGERAGPPDDCGGVPGYEELLEVLADPEHPEFASMQMWAASMKGTKAFEPEAFDEQRVRFSSSTARLKRLLKATGQVRRIPMDKGR